MTNLGIGALVLLGFSALVVVVQMVRVWVKEHLERMKQARLCENRTCSFYTDYLQKGPQLLTHSQYHESMNAYRYWQRAAQRCEDDDVGTPHYTEKMISLYRMQVRM